VSAVEERTRVPLHSAHYSAAVHTSGRGGSAPLGACEAAGNAGFGVRSGCAGVWAARPGTRADCGLRVLALPAGWTQAASLCWASSLLATPVCTQDIFVVLLSKSEMTTRNLKASDLRW